MPSVLLVLGFILLLAWALWRHPAAAALFVGGGAKRGWGAPAAWPPRTVGEIPRAARYGSLGRAKDNPHYGQRKLLVSEIDFLARYSEPGDLVVYAGSAPGHHIAFLARLFPQLRFDLWDPREFGVRPSARLRLNVGLFTGEVADSYRGRNALLVSDIRSRPSSTGIAEDMDAQAAWAKRMDAKAWCLKFRPPMGGTGSWTYPLGGEVVLQAWGRRMTPETRLMGRRGTPPLTLDLRDYDGRLYFYNLKVRGGVCRGRVPGWLKPAGYDGCADCGQELAAIREYLEWGERHGVRDARRRVLQGLKAARGFQRIGSHPSACP